MKPYYEELPKWPGWQAGQLTPCDDGPKHEVADIHIIARCACGASFMSTSGSIALNMALRHAERKIVCPPSAPVTSAACPEWGCTPERPSPLQDHASGACPYRPSASGAT